jgi:Transglutaminase-like superfamily
MKNPTILTAQQTAAASEYSLAPDAAILLMDDGSARILHMGDSFFAVPAVGALMLQETLQQGQTAAAQHVAHSYEVALANVETELRTFLADLERRGILRRREGTVGRTTTAVALAAGILKVLLRVSCRQARAATLLNLAKLSFRLFGWTQTVMAWQHAFPRRDKSLSPREQESAAIAIDAAVCQAAAGNLLGVACKERALSCWALARMTGMPANLVIGVELYPLAGHCWCEVDSRVISDYADNVARYLPVLRFS